MLLLSRISVVPALLVFGCAQPWPVADLAYTPTAAESAECAQVPEATLDIEHSVGSRYFPDGAFYVERELDTRVRNWFSLQLCAMGEPSIWTSRREGLQIRFLWLRSFDPGVAVRIQLEDGGASLIATKLSGYGGGQAGAPATRVQSKLAPDQIAVLRQQIENDSLWSLPTNKLRSDGVTTLDGAEWVIEISEADRYTVVKRQSGDEIERIGRRLLEWSGLDIEPIY